MNFRKYMHIERFGNEEVIGIELGETYIFPKLDGTNASCWITINGTPPSTANINFHGGSRTRELSIESDNQGFYNTCLTNENLLFFFLKYPNLRLYGEWLVPHTLKTYREDTWRRFWIFDVYNDETEQYLHYETYKPLLEEFRLDYIPPLAKIKNGSYENFIHVLNQNNLFIKDGEGLGEGIVIKNYSFYNRYQNQIWAKIISSEFKEQHYKTMGCPEKESRLIEEEITEKFCTKALIEKTQAKIQNEMDGWKSQYIPRLLDTVFYELIKEDTWEFLKEFKNPTINFKTLKAFVTAKIKKDLPELF